MNAASSQQLVNLKAASDVARAETERREMELAVEQANKRAQKAKAAAAAALEEL